MRRAILCVLFAVTWLAAAVPSAHADNCTKEARELLLNDIKAPVAEGPVFVEVTCDVTLPKGITINKGLFFSGKSGNGVTVDCNFSTIDGGPKTPNDGQDMIVVSPLQRSAFEWERPENIVIKNCTVLGSVRLLGMSDSDLHNSSRCHGPFEFDRPKCAGHTARVQAAASRNIEFHNMRIVAQGHRTPVYFSPGTTNSKLLHSDISGRVISGGVAIYLDAESADNVILNNVIHVNTERREQIAVDGSARNLIAGNEITSVAKGGIFLYRNCGERGVVRHQSPQFNRIVNNVIQDKSGGPTPFTAFRKPLIWVGSRAHDKPDYCHFDDGLPFGSGVSDNDFAQHNVIADNRFVGMQVLQAIKAEESPNEYFNNVTVNASVARSSNCYPSDGFPRAFLTHGESSPLSVVNGVPGCHGLQRRCNNGRIETRAGGVCLKADRAVERFECSTTGSNRAATCRASCPAGYVIESAKAACNLEAASVSPSLLDLQGWGTLEVQRKSDNTGDGLCRLGGDIIKRDTQRLSISRRNSVAVECREHDRNGGECMISGVLACVRPFQGPVLTARPGS